MKKFFYIKQGGIAALPMVIMIAVLAVVIGVGVGGSAFLESLLSSGDYESKQALYAAEAGASDAFKRVVRNKRCNEGGTPVCDSFTVTVGSGSAAVTVSGTNPKTILSVGTAGRKRRTVQVTISYDANNKATQTEWKEIF
jgi:flagellar basal body-associated protein FliL